MTSASEQTSASKREPGYYHVVYQGYEYIALWHDKKWFFCGDPGEIDEGIFDEIYERVIVRRPSLQIELIQERLNELDKANAASIRELRLLLSSERPSPQQQPDTTMREIIEYALERIKDFDPKGDEFLERELSKVGHPDELSKAQERERWREIAVDGLPGEKYHGKWVELLKFKPIYSQPPVLFFRQWFDIDDPARYTLSKIYTHWREIELPS